MTYSWTFTKSCEKAGLPRFCAGTNRVSAPNVPPGRTGRSLNIGSYNIHGFRGTLQGGEQGDTTAGTDRAAQIASELISMNLEVVALQEVWSADIRAVLETTLSETFPFRIATGLTNSGLYLASRYPITSCDFTPFTTGEGDDALVTKGFLTATVAMSGRATTIINTHTQTKDVTQTSRVPQLEMLAEAMARLASEGLTSILVGDLNVPRYAVGDRTSQAPLADLVLSNQYKLLASLMEDTAMARNAYATVNDLDDGVLSDHATGLGYRVCRESAICEDDATCTNGQAVVDDSGKLCMREEDMYVKPWEVEDYCWTSQRMEVLVGRVDRLENEDYEYFRAFQGSDVTVLTHALSDHALLSCNVEVPAPNTCASGELVCGPGEGGECVYDPATGSECQCRPGYLQPACNSCRPGWAGPGCAHSIKCDEYEEVCFALSEVELNWFEAQEHCEATLGGGWTLACPQSYAANDAVKKVLRQQAGYWDLETWKRRAWLGIRDMNKVGAEERDFRCRYDTNTPLPPYYTFDAGDPYSWATAGLGRCVNMQGSGEWAASSCQKRRRVMCSHALDEDVVPYKESPGRETQDDWYAQNPDKLAEDDDWSAFTGVVTDPPMGFSAFSLCVTLGVAFSAVAAAMLRPQGGGGGGGGHSGYTEEVCDVEEEEGVMVAVEEAGGGGVAGEEGGVRRGKAMGTPRGVAGQGVVSKRKKQPPSILV